VLGEGGRISLSDEVMSKFVFKYLVPNFLSLCVMKAGNLLSANHTFIAFVEF
jgi:hypothetical protein